MRTRINQLTSVATTTVFLLAMVGFPLPELGPQGGEDFPCKDHGCGCTSALMCRTACCCVKQPAVETNKPEPTGGCCSTKKTTEKSKPQRVSWVIGAANCQGLNAIWVSLGMVALPQDGQIACQLARHIIRDIPRDQSMHSLNTIQIDPPPPQSCTILA